MKAKIFKASDGDVQDFGNMKLKNILNDPSLPYSINWIERISNEVREGYEAERDVAFYVLDGKSTAIIDGEEIEVAGGDLVYFPKNTKWKFMKGITLLAISSPPYDRTKRIYTE